MSWKFREDHWRELAPGTTVAMLKRNIYGEDRARYPGVIQKTLADDPWVEIEAVWRTPKNDQGLISFEPGDIIREFFSWRHPYNVFSVFTPEGMHKGWYANVTYPSFIEMRDDQPVLVWHDLLLDVVADADGNPEKLDDDELADSGLAETNPDLYRRIIEARDEILVQLRDRTGPFVASRFD